MNRKAAAKVRLDALALVTETVPAKYTVQHPVQEEPKIFFAKALTYLRESTCDLVLACLDEKSGHRQIVECLKDELIGECFERIDHEHFGYESVEAMDFLREPIFTGIKQQLCSIFHKPWAEHDYEEFDENGWTRVIPLYVSDRARDEEGNYFVYTPSMHYLLETGERDNLFLHDEPNEFPAEVSGGGDGDKSGYNHPPPDETSRNAAASESGGDGGHNAPPPLVTVPELVKVDVKAEVRVEKILMKTMKVKCRRRETEKKRRETKKERRRKKRRKVTTMGHCPLVVQIRCP